MIDLGKTVKCSNCGHLISFNDNDLKHIDRINTITSCGNIKEFDDINTALKCYCEAVEYIRSQTKTSLGICLNILSYDYINCPNCNYKINVTDDKIELTENYD